MSTLSHTDHELSLQKTKTAACHACPPQEQQIGTATLYTHNNLHLRTPTRLQPSTRPSGPFALLSRQLIKAQCQTLSSARLRVMPFQNHWEFPAWHALVTAELIGSPKPPTLIAFPILRWRHGTMAHLMQGRSRRCSQEEKAEKPQKLTSSYAAKPVVRRVLDKWEKPLRGGVEEAEKARRVSGTLERRADRAWADTTTLWVVEVPDTANGRGSGPEEPHEPEYR